MQIEKSLNQDVLVGAVALLQRHVPDLTPTTLVNAIRNFDTEGKPHTAEIEKPLSRKEAADLLRVSLVTLDKFIRTGALPSVKIGRHVRIPANAVRDAITGKEGGAIA